MLAQNFKTPTDLGISDAEFEALVKVLGMMERGEISYVRVSDDDEAWDHKGQYVGLFNMNEVYSTTQCGTAACIAGTCDWLFVTKFQGRFWSGFSDRGDLPASLRDLFAPNVIDEETWKDLSVEQAAIAIRNYLSSGEARWTEVLAE